MPLRVYVPDLSVLLFDDDPVLELLLLPVAPSRQAPGLDVREQAPATNKPCSSVLPALEPPLEELELLDELELDRFATANDGCTKTLFSAIFVMNDLHHYLKLLVLKSYHVNSKIYETNFRTDF